jgi:ribonuclease HI/catechol 2,3-dioxygenase-like lactoylglutathione lyase family enzyme
MAGEAAIGVILKAPLDEISDAPLDKFSEPIGRVHDHHVAEYRALIRGLEAARSRGIDHLRVCLDSALVVNQFNGTWKVKAAHLKPLYEQASSLKKRFADIEIVWASKGERRRGSTVADSTWAVEAQAGNLAACRFNGWTM